MRQVATTDFSGGLFRRVFMASTVNQAGFEEKQSKEKRSKFCIFRGPEDRIIDIVYS
jgi:hypothetical protein